MPRGIPWDDLPQRFPGNAEKAAALITKIDEDSTMKPREIDFQKDSIEIGRRLAFGLLVSIQLINYLFKCFL